MSKILDFKKFVEDVNREMRVRLEKYFSDEIEMLNDITDMVREWEDEGFEFEYHLLLDHGDAGAYLYDKDRSQELISKELNLLSLFKEDINNIYDLIEMMESFGKIIHLDIHITHPENNRTKCAKEARKNRGTCVESLSSRIKSAYPDLVVSTPVGFNKIKIVSE